MIITILRCAVVSISSQTSSSVLRLPHEHGPRRDDTIRRPTQAMLGRSDGRHRSAEAIGRRMGRLSSAPSQVLHCCVTHFHDLEIDGLGAIESPRDKKHGPCVRFRYIVNIKLGLVNFPDCISWLLRRVTRSHFASLPLSRGCGIPQQRIDTGTVRERRTLA